MSGGGDIEYNPSYRERRVDKKFAEHERRITANERRWLMAKGGAIGATLVLAAIEGSGAMFSIISGLL